MTESEYKKQVFARWKKEKKFKKVFCIESEETVPGFPDVIASKDGNENWIFYEFKASDYRGVIKFKKSQPAFYNRHHSIQIVVMAYNNKTKHEHIFYADRILDKESIYCINGKFEVNLSKAEEVT